MKRKILGFVLFCALIIPSSIAMAASYSSWYEIDGGIWTPYMNMSSGSTVKVETSPFRNDAGSGAKVYLYLQKQTWYGYEDVANSWNYADRYDVSTEMKTSSSGSHRVYFRNYTGLTMGANFTISYW